MADTVRGQPVISQVWVRYRASRCGFCGGQTDTSTGFSVYALVSPVSIIPPVLHTHLSIAGCTCCQQLAASLCSTLILKNRNNVVSPFVWTVQELSHWYHWWRWWWLWWWLFKNLIFYRAVVLCDTASHSLLSHVSLSNGISTNLTTTFLSFPFSPQFNHTSESYTICALTNISPLLSLFYFHRRNGTKNWVWWLSCGPISASSDMTAETWVSKLCSCCS